MNLTDFAKDLEEEFDIPEYKSKKILSYLNKRIRNRLLYGVEISLRKIGTFKLRVRKPKKYLNFQSGKIGISEKCYYLDFKPTKKMSDDLKEKPVY